MLMIFYSSSVTAINHFVIFHISLVIERLLYRKCYYVCFGFSVEHYITFTVNTFLHLFFYIICFSFTIVSIFKTTDLVQCSTRCEWMF
uniref:Uncharacterized protein n=1 Tax=Anguilla anguilla TaxID=7936 RepID=A0A0E9XH15_ANGAN